MCLCIHQEKVLQSKADCPYAVDYSCDYCLNSVNYVNYGMLEAECEKTVLNSILESEDNALSADQTIDKEVANQEQRCHKTWWEGLARGMQS